MADVLLVEDEESVSRGIAFTLEREGHPVRSCAAISEARRALAAQYPEIVICDINLPDGNGLDFVAQVRERGNAYIICLTALDQEPDQVAGYGAGADDYMTKPFSLSVLSLKIRAFLERRSGGEGSVLHSGEIRMIVNEMRAYRGEEEILLTRNEWKLLKCFLEHPMQILSKRQILEQLFDSAGNFVDDNTVAVNVTRLRDKVETDRSHPAYIRNVRGLGYIWSCPVSRRQDF